MPRAFVAGAAAVLLLLPARQAPAQEATERFIPIGRSPGLSGKLTYVGEIAGVDAAARALVLGAGASRHSVRVVPETRIWIDRTPQGKTNDLGRFEDLLEGRRVEVMYRSGDARDVADWIKVAPGNG